MNGVKRLGCLTPFFRDAVKQSHMLDYIIDDCRQAARPLDGNEALSSPAQFPLDGIEAHSGPAVVRVLPADGMPKSNVRTA